MPPPRVISSASATVTAARTEASREQATQGHASVFVGKRKRRRKARTSAPKRMVNPFSTYYSQSILLPKDWHGVFKDPSRALTVDVGCARGTLLDKLAAKHPEQNFLGIEIRPRMVEEALARTKHLQNLHFIAGKFSADQAARLVDSLPPGVIRTVCFQFPDPWRKKKQMRRRVLQPELAAVLAEKLPSGSYIYISSDVKDVCEGMREILKAQPRLTWMDNPKGKRIIDAEDDTEHDQVHWWLKRYRPSCLTC